MTGAVSSPGTESDVADFLARVTPAGRREDAYRLDAVFRATTGFGPRLWTPSILGYGRYDYVYSSGHAGQSFATGFAPRSAKTVVYIMPGYADFSEILSRLGPHKLGKSCLYLGRLTQVDLDVLAELVAAGLADLSRQWQVHPE